MSDTAVPESVIQQALHFTAVVTVPNGEEIKTTLGDLWLVENYNIQTAIVQGARIGSSIIMMAVLFAVARKYNSALFILYQLNFLFTILSSLMLSLTIEQVGNGGASTLAGVALIDQHFVNLRTAGNIFTLLLLWSLIATLLFQIYTAYGDAKMAKPYLRPTIMAVCILCCMPCFVIWGIYCIFGIYGAWASFDTFMKVYHQLLWTRAAAWPVFAATTGFCSIVLSIKLVQVSRARARMGLESFDAIRVLIVITTQNSVIPVILMIIAATRNDGLNNPSVIGGCATLVTAVLLPFGYIWAQFRMLVLTAEPDSHDERGGSTLAGKFLHAIGDGIDWVQEKTSPTRTTHHAPETSRDSVQMSPTSKWPGSHVYAKSVDSSNESTP